VNRQLLGYFLTVEDLYLEYKGRLEGCGLQAGDWHMVNWVKEFKKDNSKLPTWEELKVKYKETPEKENLSLKFVKEEIGRYIRDEKLKGWIIKVAESIDSRTIDYSRVFDDVRRLNTELDFKDIEGVDVGDMYNQMVDKIRSFEQHDRVSTGLSGLDKELEGGWGKGEIAVLIAPPGYGKTMFLLNAMYSILERRKNVLFVSFELSEERLLERLYRRIARASRADIRKDKTGRIKDVLQRFFRLMKVRGYIVYRRPKTWGVEDMALHIDRLKSRGIEIDTVIVDYLDKLSLKSKDYRLGLRDLTEDLRYLSIDRNVRVITATQANRLSLTAPVITEEHVSESFGKVEVSDIVLSLGRTQKDEQKNQGRIVLLKSRDRGGRGVIIPIRMEFDKALMEDVK